MKTTYIMPYRRKREGKTNYRRRLALLKSQTARLIVRKTGTSIVAQIATFDAKGDKILTSVTSTQLVKRGWKGSGKNIPAAYLTGLLAGKQALAKGIKEVILDSGMITPTTGSRVYAALRGAKEAGLAIQVDEEIFPSDDRIQGKHISAFAEKAQGTQFTKYKKEGLTDVTKHFEEIKAKILSEK